MKEPENELGYVALPNTVGLHARVILLKRQDVALCTAQVGFCSVDADAALWFLKLIFFMTLFVIKKMLDFTNVNEVNIITNLCLKCPF